MQEEKLDAKELSATSKKEKQNKYQNNTEFQGTDVKIRTPDPVYTIEYDGHTGLYSISPNRGRIPSMLSGRYTLKLHAVNAIKAYDPQAKIEGL